MAMPSYYWSSTRHGRPAGQYLLFASLPILDHGDDDGSITATTMPWLKARNPFLVLPRQTTPPTTKQATGNPKLLANSRALRQTDSDGEQDPMGYLRQVREKARDKIKAILERGRSLIRHVVVPLRKTELEAPQEQEQRLVLVDTDTDMMHDVNTTAATRPTTTTRNEEESVVLPLLPKGPRWAMAHPSIDLTGTWAPMIDSEFQSLYGKYLENCGTSLVFRQLCLNFARVTRERIDQVEQGRLLHLHGQSPAGGWKRTLISSGADHDQETFEPLQAEFLDPDKEMVQVEAWWEEQGTVHKSWLRNKPGVAGGEFESTRYLKTNPTDGTVELICESIFHPAEHDRNNPSSRFKPGFVRWRYRRVS
jgi:hypothetical protein